MSHWDEISQKAAAKNAALNYGPESCPAAELLLELAEAETAIPRVPLSAGDPLLYGAQAAIYEGMLFYDADASPWQALFSQAHEFGHHWLAHGSSSSCSADDVDPEASADDPLSGTGKVKGYGPRERREREANLFALEFLLPGFALRRAYLQENKSVAEIAAQTGVPSNIVMDRLAAALLSPLEAAPAETGEQQVIKLDPSQAAAAFAAQGPLLLEAGPGTGKTRTLVSRVLWLLEQETPPAAILALTFSNKAAEEMRSRVAALAPTAAPLIWMGTFHAFGLELLSKYGTRIGLPAAVQMLSPLDAVLLLEQNLPQLKLRHYENLYEPTSYLRDILSAISRAKDELVSPRRYYELAAAMLAKAEAGEEYTAAEKALEVAGVYEFYQRHLEREGLLDFGDLIGRAVELLQQHPDVRQAVQQSYGQILVDEYQDVNRASGVLMREVAGEGKGLWVVGDARQAIYRFRGAAPQNMRLFQSADFPAARVLRLDVNYRSLPNIVSTFAELAPKMSASPDNHNFTPWQVARKGDPGRVEYEIAEDEVAEAEGIAAEILAQHEAGLPFSDMAVLMRSHSALSRVGAVLEQAGVPLLYLGDVFERPEIRDMLALLALSSGDRSALVRVANFAEYAIPPADTNRFLKQPLDDQQTLAEAMREVALGAETSPEGYFGLLRLSEHLAALAYEPLVWRYLARYLFEISDYARNSLFGDSAAYQQQRLAIYQLIRFAREQDVINRHLPNPRRSFLRYIRRLELLGEGRQLSQLPAWSEEIDAVRLLTVHASKGLEFRSVFLPGLAKGHFPSRGQSNPCPPPQGMLEKEDDTGKDEEEECLFFVALSRARDTLVVSRAKRYGATNSNVSPLLDKIRDCLPREIEDEPTWPRHAPVETISKVDPPDDDPIFTLGQVELYMECPRHFYYEVVAALDGQSEESAYHQFHISLRLTLDWIEREREAERTVSVEQALAQLREVWAEKGPVEHDHETIYLHWAEIMVVKAVKNRSQPQAVRNRESWEVKLNYGRITFKPDYAEVTQQDDGTTNVLLERRRTGQRSSSEADRDIYALYHSGAAAAYPDANKQVQVHYLGAGEHEEVKLTEKKLTTRLKRYDHALEGIAARRFDPNPSDRVCPRCPFYFICPSLVE